ncbi:Uncharacterised protein [uncultured archaeon]|nr:Uncharacterised protein [uncultured archaeon]
MEIKKVHKVLIGFAVVVVAVVAVLSVLSSSKKSQDSVNFFYGETCPHCKAVEQFIADNNINATLNIIGKEVSSNRDNLAEMSSYARKCGLSGDTLEVPFVAANGRCYMGEEEVTSFFRSKINQTK